MTSKSQGKKKTPFRRRRNFYFTQSSLQRRYLKMVALAMLVPSSFIAISVYYIIWQKIAEEIFIPEVIAQLLFPALENTNRLLLIVLPLLFIGILIYANLITHRITGPIERIERELEGIAKTGNFKRRVSVRRRDELRRFIFHLNRVLAKAESQAKPKS